jgi:signal peptidase I
MNFALIMLSLLIVTGGIWLLDKFVLAPRRVGAFRARLRDDLNRRGVDDATLREDAEKKVLSEVREPWYVEYPKSFFPIILIVFLLRSFVAEPFKIPSGSMIPTLLVGDYILVNKFTLGIRIPVANVKVLDINQPARGDVMVFRYPENPSTDYIKRVVGLPGDKVEYRNKRLTINGELIKAETAPDFQYEDGLSLIESKQFWETLGTHRHPILVNVDSFPLTLSSVRTFPHRVNCNYEDTGFTCTVPKGHYFMMGDNRDRSSDSRYWGFVPDENIVGKAFLVLVNFGHLERIGTSIY